MAKRRFQLPGIEDLSKEQEKVRALPLDGQHLIVGGPGTGKSVMALLRSRVLAEEHLNYRFLVFNHLLNQSSKVLFGSTLNSVQWQTWFHGAYRKCLGNAVPRFEPKPGQKFGAYDWGSIISTSQSWEGDNEAEDVEFLVVDEGQDMPPEFYETLANLAFDNFFVVADQNQQIVDGKNSSRKDLQIKLGLEVDEVIELKENYRNNLAVARLARHFYVVDPASPPPALPEAPPYQLKMPILFRYKPEQFERLIRRILIMADNNPRKLIGIICPNNKVRLKFYEALSGAEPQLDNGRPQLTTYKSGDKHRMPFDEGGIMVINAQACKGLEFEVVFIADMDLFSFSQQDQDRVKRLFYVMVSRAVEHVIILRQDVEQRPIDTILPDETEFLEIK